ncbi:hypothetical protein BGW38_000795 [Lunasporangiospora selenospora]|uniref:Uncharacterized protein n=1 Tax=Lunasporangiospora selenospora TaxID=979761 RepID=A0A9P6KEQ3_9FUNG|nr:hypothetical protein BGW38_000795 [Lunasporangiospora selenospora]
MPLTSAPIPSINPESVVSFLPNTEVFPLYTYQPFVNLNTPAIQDFTAIGVIYGLGTGNGMRFKASIADLTFQDPITAIGHDVVSPVNPISQINLLDSVSTDVLAKRQLSPLAANPISQVFGPVSPATSIAAAIGPSLLNALTELNRLGELANGPLGGASLPGGNTLSPQLLSPPPPTGIVTDTLIQPLITIQPHAIEPFPVPVSSPYTVPVPFSVGVPYPVRQGWDWSGSGFGDSHWGRGWGNPEIRPWGDWKDWSSW